MKFSIKEIKSDARKALGGQPFNREWCYGALAVFIVGALMGLTSYLFFISFLFFGALQAGFTNYWWRIYRGEHTSEFKIMLSGFKRFGSHFVTGFLLGLYTVLWSMLFVIPGIIKAYSYSLAFYIKADNPYISANEAITESRRLMVGNKFRLFRLQLSFIGWIFIIFFTFGLASFWATAYMNTAMASFYDAVRVEDQARRKAYESGSNSGYRNFTEADKKEEPVRPKAEPVYSNAGAVNSDAGVSNSSAEPAGQSWDEAAPKNDDSTAQAEYEVSK